ncbi:MAG: methyltransferase domain-containing protein [Ignavibacteriales bacterium]|nr:methyltransferase domain-containing protein [Ignavibacteriales bacterium]
MPESSQHDEYLLGVNQQELERLQFQHSVWGSVTRKFLARLGVQSGCRCLDVGAGPGLVSIDLREMVGETGEVTALDPSEFYLDSLRKQATALGWTNVSCLQGTAEQTSLPAGAYDIVFVRWVVAFVPDAEKFLTRLFATLRPGGIVAIQDYYYEGLSLYPRGGPWDGMPDIVRAYYRSGGGDAYVTGKIPEMFARHGLRLIDFTPTCLAGGPTSGVMEWAHRFFSLHIPLMADKGIISHEQADHLLKDWQAHRQNPNTLFFSPLVVDVAGKRPE